MYLVTLEPTTNTFGREKKDFNLIELILIIYFNEEISQYEGIRRNSILFWIITALE